MVWNWDHCRCPGQAASNQISPTLEPINLTPGVSWSSPSFKREAAWTKCRWRMYNMNMIHMIIIVFLLEFVHHPDIQNNKSIYLHKTQANKCTNSANNRTPRVLHEELKASKAAKHARSFTRTLAGRKYLCNIMQSSLVQFSLIRFTFYRLALFESEDGWFCFPWVATRYFYMSINVGVLVSYGYLSCIAGGAICRSRSIRPVLFDAPFFRNFRVRTSCGNLCTRSACLAFPFEAYGIVSDGL